MWDSNNAVVWRASNHAFDREVAQDSIGGLNIGFPGQYYNKETEFWYNGHRDYDPSTDRYLQPDPFGIGGGINPYLYASGNPLMNVDPLGLFDWPSLPQGVVNVAAGFGDTLSFGATAWARSKLGIDGGVNACSSGYGFGEAAGIIAGLADGQGEAKIGGVITGYTWHVLERAMFRDGVGVNPASILDTVRNPETITNIARNNTVRYEGTTSVVVVNQEGKVVTTWSTNRTAHRSPKGN